MLSEILGCLMLKDETVGSTGQVMDGTTLFSTKSTIPIGKVHEIIILKCAIMQSKDRILNDFSMKYKANCRLKHRISSITGMIMILMRRRIFHLKSTTGINYLVADFRQINDFLQH